MSIINSLIISFWEIPTTVKLISLLVLFIIHILVKKNQFNKKYKLPPGPRAWPVIGNLPAILKTKPWDYYKQLRRTYGDIVLCQFGMVPTVVISGFKYFTEAFVAGDTDFAGRPPLTSWDPVLCGGNDIIMARKITPRWVAMRKYFHDILRTFILSPPFLSCIEKASARCFKTIDARTEPNFPAEDIMTLVLNMMFSLVYGQDFEYDDPLFLKLQRNHHRFQAALLPGMLESMFPLTKYLPYLPGKDVLKDCGQFREKLHEGRIIQKLKDHSWEDGTGLLDHLIRQMKQTEKKETGYRLQIIDLIAILTDFELGSTDTTEHTLIWTVLFALKFNGVQDKIHAELDDVLGDNPIKLEEFDKERLPYLMAVVKESMRFKLIIHHFLPHATTCDTKLGGYDIPVGTNILINVDSIHHDKEAWGDPEVFRPERFLDENGRLLPKPDHLVTFGGGRRKCPGEPMGTKMVPYLLARILQRYKLEPAPGEVLDIEPIVYGTWRITKPYKVTYMKRK